MRRNQLATIILVLAGMGVARGPLAVCYPRSTLCRHQQNAFCLRLFASLIGMLCCADHGDPDLQAALQQVQGAVHVPLVVFGHMHHRLNSRHGGALRKMALINAETGTVFLNAAVVPRVEEVCSTSMCSTPLIGFWKLHRHARHVRPAGCQRVVVQYSSSEAVSLCCAC